MDAKSLVVVPENGAGPPAGLPDGVKVETRPDGALVFTYRRTEMGAGTVLDAVRASGIAIRDVSTEEPHLEDVFMSLTRPAA